MVEDEQPLLVAQGLTKWYGRQLGCRNVSFELYAGEVLAVVGESGSGKTTLLQLLSCQIEASAGEIGYRMRDGVTRDVATLSEAERRFLFRTEGAMCIRIRRSACAWRPPPARMWASA